VMDFVYIDISEYTSRRARFRLVNACLDFEKLEEKSGVSPTKALEALIAKKQELEELRQHFTYTSPGLYPDSQQGQEKPENMETRYNQPDSGNFRRNTGQNDIRIQPPRGTNAPIEDYVADPKPKQPEQPPEEKPDPSIADLIDRVQRAVWNHQEEQPRAPSPSRPSRPG